VRAMVVVLFQKIVLRQLKVVCEVLLLRYEPAAR
jgi:hypothetical protein